ncbi:MAG TPA: hypothetical protein VMT19_10075 [Thermoanaerobaculaceae bacterium]|nr:hypothetical protein [Thermoanaerobaculaceae bacterium]
MTVKVTVKGRFVYNGKVYGSLEELPEHVREAYEKAAGSPGGFPAGSAVARKIVFNGVEYDSPDAMPAEERRLYESALAMARSGHLVPGGEPGRPERLSETAAPTVPVSAAPIEPGSSGARRVPVALVLGLALLLLLLGFYLYTAAAPK